jgi:hypothetical protein
MEFLKLQRTRRSQVYLTTVLAPILGNSTTMNKDDDDDDSELAVPVPFQKPAPRQSRQSKRAATVARLLFTSSATA